MTTTLIKEKSFASNLIIFRLDSQISKLAIIQFSRKLQVGNQKKPNLYERVRNNSAIHYCNDVNLFVIIVPKFQSTIIDWQD